MMSSTMMPTKASTMMMSSMMSAMVSSTQSTKPTSMMPASKPRSHAPMMTMMPMTTHSHTKSTTTTTTMMMIMMMMVVSTATKSSRPRAKASSQSSARTELVFSRGWISACAHSHAGAHMMTAITAAVRGETRAHGVLMVMLSLVCLVGGANVGQWFTKVFQSTSIVGERKYINVMTSCTHPPMKNTYNPHSQEIIQGKNLEKI
ncbi:hypothetical protein BDV36DRAFT_250043, partial [Aspergillus pseudocaelatus]